jgi:hypothetical protein
MTWGIIAIIAITGWIIYTRRKGTITLTKEQAELVRQLAQKERAEIEKQRQKIIEDGAAEGKTIPIESIFKHVKDSVFIENQKEALLGKYGPNIPVDVAYRLLKQFEHDEEQPWSQFPGCFERHLQCREGSLLFPKHRRTVTSKEIEEAKEKDLYDQKQFRSKFELFLSGYPDKLKTATLIESRALLQEVQSLLKELAEIGGGSQAVSNDLEGLENTIIETMNKVIPDGSELLQQARSLAAMERIPFIAQCHRKDSPILSDEITPALLSEDLETISLVGYVSRSFGPGFKPNEENVKKCLGEVVLQGLSQKRAIQIHEAWNKER